jgi:hypothetical protein
MWMLFILSVAKPAVEDEHFVVPAGKLMTIRRNSNGGPFAD